MTCKENKSWGIEHLNYKTCLKKGPSSSTIEVGANDCCFL